MSYMCHRVMPRSAFLMRIPCIIAKSYYNYVILWQIHLLKLTKIKDIGDFTHTNFINKFENDNGIIMKFPIG